MKQRELDEIKSILQAACDRDWEDETLYQTAVIAANAIYWRDREIEFLRKRCSEAERDATRWRKARTILTVEDIKRSNADMAGFTPLVEENEKADAAIDAAMSSRSTRYGEDAK